MTNGADLGRFSPRPKDEALAHELGLTGRFAAGYVGTHGMAHALDTILDAAMLLKETVGGRDIRFILLGHGAAKAALKARAEALGLTSVIFIDSVPKDEVARYWSLLDVSIIHLKRTELFTTVIPSKLFECMAMGVPVLHGVAGESAAIVEREGVGLVFEPENPEALAAQLARLATRADELREMALKGPQAAARYDRAALAKDMLRILQDTSDAARARRRPRQAGEASPSRS